MDYDIIIHLTIRVLSNYTVKTILGILQGEPELFLPGEPFQQEMFKHLLDGT